jgi:hypothetical protein
MPGLNRRALLIGGLTVGLVTWDRRPALAQDQRALLGTWVGEVALGPKGSWTRLDFIRDGEKIKWRWYWYRAKAEGVVDKVALPSVELSGAYLEHPTPTMVGSPITMALTLNGDQLEGSGLTVRTNQPYRLSLTRQKKK